MRLKRSFYLRPPEIVAKDLLGKSLYYRGTEVIIVEVESYGANDPACHAFRGKTPRTEPMFKEGGRSYVYFVYGMHFCFNVVTEKSGSPSAVLIRGGVPVNDYQQIKDRRGREIHPEKILIGPGNFCKGLGIGKDQNDIDLCESPDLFIGSGSFAKKKLEIGISPRIGISSGQDRLWRFYLKTPIQL